MRSTSLNSQKVRAHTVSYYTALFLGQWISPNVTGDRPPPIYAFTLTSINNSSAILFGGFTANGPGSITNGPSNNIYILNFTDTSVVSIMCVF